MRLFEYEAKEILRKSGIPVPNGATAGSISEVSLAIEQVGLPVAIKAQVLAAGRGKAGGIKFADSLEEAAEQAKKLMSEPIKGHRVKKVLIEEKLDIKHEYYFGVTIDQLSGMPIIMLSTEGGVEVETIAEERPETLVSKRVSSSRGLFQFEAREMCRQLGLCGSLLLKSSDILYLLHGIFCKYDALIAEINPLVVTAKDEMYAVGAVLESDDNSLFRHSDIKLDLSERLEDDIKREAVQHGLSYVRLDGDIGVIGSGAGLTMATIDLVKDFGGKPANFLETGGGITEQLMKEAVELVLKDKRLRALLINLYGGINPMPAATKGIVKAFEKLRPKIPILVKVVGNNQEEAWNMLENAGISVVKEIQTEVAVKKLMSMLGE